MKLRIITYVLLTGALLFGLKAYRSLKNLPESDIRSASVKITNRAMTSGGTGIVLFSSKTQSDILTNDHVCKLLKKAGGLVLSDSDAFQATSILESEVSDLCLVTVSDDLKARVEISPKGPNAYDKATVSGHPALMPNVLSTGHFSGRQIIQVMTGMKECTPEEIADPSTALPCAFFGGLPVVKSYESVLVTATIMPGSSGSGVYNSKEQLSGVVFAGSTEFGYAWTVPYEQVINFLFKEHQNLKSQNLSQEIAVIENKDESKRMKEVERKCSTATDEVIINYCAIIKRDMVYRE